MQDGDKKLIPVPIRNPFMPTDYSPGQGEYYDSNGSYWIKDADEGWILISHYLDLMLYWPVREEGSNEVYNSATGEYLGRIIEQPS